MIAGEVVIFFLQQACRQRSFVGRILQCLGEFELGARTFGDVGGFQIGRQRIEFACGFFTFAGSEQGLNQVQAQFGFVGLGADGIARGLHLFFGQQVDGDLFDGVIQRRLDAFEVRCQPFLDHRFRLHAHETIERATILDQHHRRQRAHAERTSELRMFIGVDLGQQHLAFQFVDHFLDDRGELFARRAPRRPEVDEHRLACRCEQHFFFEIGLGGVKNKPGCGHGGHR